MLGPRSSYSSLVWNFNPPSYTAYLLAPCQTENFLNGLSETVTGIGLGFKVLVS